MVNDSGRVHGEFSGRALSSDRTTEQGSAVLVLEDLTPAAAGNQITGCTIEDARSLVLQMSAIHSKFWGDNRVPTADVDQLMVVGEKYVDAGWQPFVERYESDIRNVRSTYEWGRDNISSLIRHTRGARQTLTHGDLHFENVLFSTTDESRVTLIDWQIAVSGLAAYDVASILINGLSPDDRRSHELGILKSYFSSLTSEGNIDYQWEQFLLEYRAATISLAFRPIIILGGSGGTSYREDRFDVADALFQRSVAAIRDHDPVSAFEELKSQ